MARICVVGLGKLGGPLAAVLSSKGHRVVGVDKNVDFVESINHRSAPIQEHGFQDLLEQHPFTATTSYEKALRNSDATFVIVPTPSGPDARFSNDYVLDALEQIGKNLNDRYHLVVICSTVMPGSMEGPIRETLEKASNRVLGKNLGLCYSPEFIALGSVIEDMLNPDMVLIGESDRKAGDRLEKILSTVNSAPIQRMNLVNAELAKISINTYITMKISFANQMAEVCEALPGADAHEVADALGLDTRIGRKYLTPGTAFGGPCFPRDTKAFAALCRGLNTTPWLASATDAINLRQTERLFLIGEAILNRRTVKSPPVVGILGLSFKPETPVTEESPGVLLSQRFTDAGFCVRVWDPIVKSGAVKIDASHAHSPSDLIENADLIYVMTPSRSFKSLFPYGFHDHRELIVVDCWNIIEPGPWDETNIVRIGRGSA